MKEIRRLREPPEPQQPVKCKGCIWGRWEGSAQFCSKTACTKSVMREGELKWLDRLS